MILENELIQLFLGLGGLTFILINHTRLKKLPAISLLLYGFYCLVGAWVFTVVEGFVWPRVLNLLEHLCYLGSSILVLIWCLRLTAGRRRGTQ